MAERGAEGAAVTDRRRKTRRPADRHLGHAPWVLALRALVWAVAAALLLGCGVTWYTYRSLADGLTKSDALDAVREKAPPHLDNAVNLLLIGLDSRKDMNGNDLPRQFVQDQLHAGSSAIGYYNTNTLILMHIPPTAARSARSRSRGTTTCPHSTAMAPRKATTRSRRRTPMRTTEHDKLAKQGVKGPVWKATAVRPGARRPSPPCRHSGVPIDHFAEVNLLGFYDIAKVLQPITVCLKHPVKDRYSGADFPAGVQQLNAKQALPSYGSGTAWTPVTWTAPGASRRSSQPSRTNSRTGCLGRHWQTRRPVQRGEERCRSGQFLERPRLRAASPQSNGRQRGVPHPAHRGLRPSQGSGRQPRRCSQGQVDRAAGVRTGPFALRR